jgi:acetyl-CoA C-acetyltransferase
MKRNAAIIGVGETPFTSRQDYTNPELSQQAALKALDMAGMTMADIDAVVYSMAPAEFLGVLDPDKWAVDAVGGLDKSFMRVHTGGATGGSAAQAGYYHVASGLFDAVLVVGADKVRECKDSQQVLNTIWDPMYERQFGLTTITMAAYQAVRRMHKYGTTEEQMARVAVRNWKNAMNNPSAHLKGTITVEDVMASPYYSWPIKRLDTCPSSAGGAAIVIVSEEKAKKLCTRPAWIKGCHEIANTVFMGDQMGGAADMDYADWDELAMAAKVAYRQAGIVYPLKEIQVADVYAPFTVTELSIVEALGFCKKGESERLNETNFFDMDGEVAVSPSGGSLCNNPIAVTALCRVCDAALQVLGKAPPKMQVKNVKNAVATGIGGSFQFHTIMVVGSDHN